MNKAESAKAIRGLWWIPYQTVCRDGVLVLLAGRTAESVSPSSIIKKPAKVGAGRKRQE